MTTEDKKEIKIILGETLEEVILPVIQEIRDDVTVLKDDVSVLKDDVSGLKDDVNTIENRLDRIERKQDAEIVRNDKLSVTQERHEKILSKSK